MEIARGDQGISAVDEDGAVHRLRHGEFDVESRPRRLAKAVASLGVDALAKGEYGPIPTGARWITAHSGGDGDGHPILITPHPHGGWRVIGGAGGKMNYLRLTDVKSPAEWKAKARAKKQADRDTEKASVAAMSPEERRAHHEAKRAERTERKKKQAAVHAAEHEVVKAVREKVGGVEPDLAPEELEGLSPAAAEKVVRQHHRRQFSQAVHRREELAHALAGDREARIEDRRAVARIIETDPQIAPDVTAAGQRELAEIEAEREQRKQPLRTGADVVDLATVTAAKHLDTVDHDAVRKEIEQPPDHDSASGVERDRAHHALDAAMTLHEAAKGTTPPEEPHAAEAQFKLVQDALDRAGVTRDDDPEVVRAALEREAGIALRRSQAHGVAAERYEDLEGKGKGDSARKQLTMRDAMRGLDREVAEHLDRLGLRDRDKAPLKEPEVAEIMSVLGDFDKLHRLRADLDDLVATAEDPAGAYHAARDAFHLQAGPPPDHVVETVNEMMLRDLAQRITGAASPERPAYVRAVSDGHFGRLADASLALDHQIHVDRPVVDALGLTNAAHLTRAALEQSGHDPKAVLDALERFHVKTQPELTIDALDRAEKFTPHLEASVHGVDDIEHALNQLDANEDDLDEAQRHIGSAIGQMEATAALGQAFRGKVPSELTVPLSGDTTSQVTQLAAAGLGPGDYQIDRENGVARIPRSSWHKLMTPTSAAEVQTRKDVEAIKRGDADEPGWLPHGFVSRALDSFRDAPLEKTRYAPALSLGGDVRQSLRDHVGGRLADGERPIDVERDLLAPDRVSRAPDQAAYLDEVRSLFPHTKPEDLAQDTENKRIRSERSRLTDAYKEADGRGDADAMAAHLAGLHALGRETAVPQRTDQDFADHYEQIASDYMERSHPDAAPIHARSLLQSAPEDQVREAVYRALTDQPSALAAFRPIGELTHSENAAIQDYFYRKSGATDRSWRKEYEEQLGTAMGEAKNKGEEEPAGGGLFGGGLFGGAPKKEAEPWTPERFAKLNPEAAQRLAELYPREASGLFEASLGERPAEQQALPDDVRSVVEQHHAADPTASPADVAERTRETISRRAAAEKLGIPTAGLEQRLAERIPGTNEPTPEASKLRAKLDVQRFAHPVHLDTRKVDRLIGARVHDSKVAQHGRRMEIAGTPWSQFVALHGDRGVAIQALQDQMRGDFNESLAKHYGRVTGRELPTGVADIHNRAIHLAAMSSPKEREALSRQRAQEIAAARTRAGAGERGEQGESLGGQFLTGSALEAYRARQAEQQSIAQRQVGMFGASLFGGEREPDKIAAPEKRATLEAGERRTIGTRSEGEVASMVSALGHQFDPRGPEAPKRLFPGASMDGARVDSQRVLKQLAKTHRELAVLGTGMGKTAIAIGGFTEAHHAGEAKEGWFLTPLAVGPQFVEEMQSFTDPGRYRWKTGEGLDHNGRVDLLRDPGTHMKVMTHGAVTKTVLKMLGDRERAAPEVIEAKMRKMHPDARAAYLRQAFDAEGIRRPYVYVDEAHMLTTRDGAPESQQAMVIRALTHPTNTTRALFGTATPHKNDASEMHAMASLVRPDRFGDRDEFTRRFGAGSTYAPDALRRELDPYVYSAKIPPEGVERVDVANPQVVDGVKRERGHLELNPRHQADVDKVGAAYERAQQAVRDGGVDVEATRALSPQRFEGKTPGEQDAIARELAPALGMLRDNATRKAIDQAPGEYNTKLRAMTDVIQHDRKTPWTDIDGKARTGKRSLVFADSVETAKRITDHLESQGIRSRTYHGALTHADRAAWRRGFKGGAFDVGVVTSAGEAGLQLHEANVVHHFDVPTTAKSFTQRTGRAFRQRQRGDVDVHSWTTNTDYEHRTLRRLRSKERLASVFEDPLGPLDEHGLARVYADTLAHQHAAADMDRLPLAAK